VSCTSCWPVDLLPIVTDIFEGLLKLAEDGAFVPGHRISFERRCSAVGWVCRVLQRMGGALEGRHRSSATFLDIFQPFDKVWHTRLLYKLRLFLLLNDFILLKSYLHSRHFLMTSQSEYTELSPVNTSVPQGSVQGTMLYPLYTADPPTSTKSTAATFVDDTAAVATDSDPALLHRNCKPTQTQYKNS
jgi:hypothetical protein